LRAGHGHLFAEPKENIKAGKLAGAEIEKAVNSVSLTATKAKGFRSLVSEAFAS
jgi:hypothetical protein